MRVNFSKLFILSSALILFLTAGAKLYSGTGDERLLTATDALLQVKYRYIFIAAGMAELLVAVYLVFVVFAKSIWNRGLAILWLGSNFLVYRAAAKYLEVEICPCLGTLAPNLPLTMGQVNHLLTAIVFFLMAGSVWIVFMGGEGSERSTDPVAGAGIPQVEKTGA